MSELIRLSLEELIETLVLKRATPVDLMEAVLARIEETNPDLNSVVAMRDTESLLADAREAEKRIVNGNPRPLEGVPLGVKDLEDVEGLITTMGSVPYREEVAQRDSDQVARLRAAGAIVVGKTNTPEFGSVGITKNLVFGVSRSPWNLERSPGGSSGGSSAALAGCVLPLVTGSDGGGSVRIPASFTGSVGLKPSFGRIPNGPSKEWFYLDTVANGPITKTVRDAALFLDQVAGPSAYDPNSLPAPGISYVARLDEPLPRPLRVGYSPDLAYAVVQSDIAEAVEDSVKIFEKLGHHLQHVKDGPPPVRDQWARIGSFEIGGQIYDRIDEHEKDFGRGFLASVKDSSVMTSEWWGQAARKRQQLNVWCAEYFEQFDLLVTPTVPYDPPLAAGPYPSEVDGKALEINGPGVLTTPFNMSGHPAATVRVGFSTLGLPIGMQIIGPRHRDDLVLQAAYAVERELPAHPNWPTSWKSMG